ITCAASAFFNMRMNEYLGKTPENAEIHFQLNNGKKIWKKQSGRWKKYFEGKFQLKGFYEGSIIFGTRFRNTNYELLMKLDKIDDSKLLPVDDFIRVNLGMILHNNENYYEKILKLQNIDTDKEFSGDIFYYQKGESRVSQFHMSTGENLLLSVLNSLLKRNTDRENQDFPCLLLLDEIELALHPSSLKRLISFLKEMAETYNYAIYFSTHSIELISNIQPENIFFLERHTDNTIEILNPCYPAYATRILYDHEGYDYI
ncbi:AAA family ATPase, partial [Neisseria sp. P0015.S004]